MLKTRLHQSPCNGDPPMTPNQLRFRAPGFKGFRHRPLGPCSGFKAKRHGIHISFSSFFFLLALSFLFHLEDYIGLLLWVTKTYYGSSTDPRPVSQSEKRYIASQPIDKNRCAVCELVKGGYTRLNTLELQSTKN